MALFRLGRSAPTHPVGDFWAWWAAVGHTIDPHQSTPLHRELSRRVEAIHRDLSWHFGPGTASEHRLTVSAGGAPEPRPAAERWVRAAPATGPTWEFASSQQAAPATLATTFVIAGHQLDLSEIQLVVEHDPTRRRVDVRIFHPEFSNLPRNARTQVAFLVLDWALGEDDVERWIGEVDVLDDPPSRDDGPEALKDTVADLSAARSFTSWSEVEWTLSNGRSGTASFRTYVRWIDAPTFDLHHEATVPDDGATGTEVLVTELERATGPHGFVMAHSTADGTRAFHVYSDGDDQAVTAAVAAVARRFAGHVTSQRDPGWRAVRVFTG